MKKIGRRKAYIMKIAGMYVLSAMILAIGSAVVSVNCHNTVSSTKMVLFDIEREGDELVITVMDREYRL